MTKIAFLRTNSSNPNKLDLLVSIFDGKNFIQEPPEIAVYDSKDLAEFYCDSRGIILCDENEEALFKNVTSEKEAIDILVMCKKILL